MKQNFLIFLDFMKKLFYRDRSTIWTMVVRDLRAQYVGSVFGVFWALIEPLSQVAIFGIFFGVFLKVKPDPIYRTDSYFVYLLCGLIPWQFFASAVNSSSMVLVSNSNLVKKAVGFPSEILPIINILSSNISHLIAMGLLFVIVIFSAGVSAYMPLFIIYMFFMILFAVGLGWIVSSINVYLKDVRQVIGIIMMAWMYFTPLFYSPNIIPATLLPIFKLNPMYHVVFGYRYAILAGRMLPLGDFLYLAFVSLFTFAIGGIFFRKLKPGFAEVL